MGRGTTEGREDLPKAGSWKPLMRRGTTESGEDLPKAGSWRPPMGRGTTEGGEDLPKAGSTHGTTEGGEDLPKAGSWRPPLGRGTTEGGEDLPKAGSWRPPDVGCMSTSNVCGFVTSFTLSLRISAALNRAKDIPERRHDGTTCSSFMISGSVVAAPHNTMLIRPLKL